MKKGMLGIVCLFFLFSTPLVAKDKEKICLNMIVKDEKAVITRCLESVKPLIDYWVIVDTGSTDGTQDIVKEFMKDIPGELFERPWKNFGYNRTEAIELAKGKGDFLLFIDADDWLEFDADFQFPKLDKDRYNIWRGTKSFSYTFPFLVRANLPWKSIGVTHEYLHSDAPFTEDLLENIRYVSGDNGARAGTKKFFHNIELLEAALKEDPKNSRNVFYLAESYRDAGDKVKAMKNYYKRAQMPGFPEEVFWSYLQIGHIQNERKMPIQNVLSTYYQAHRERPHRPEPIYFLAHVYNSIGKYELAYECLKGFSFIPPPKHKDILFNMNWIEEYGLLLELSISAFHLGLYQEALEASQKVLASDVTPQYVRDYVEERIAIMQQQLKRAERKADTNHLSSTKR